MGEECVGEVSHMSGESLRSSSSSGSEFIVSTGVNMVGYNKGEILLVIHNPPDLSIRSEAQYIPSL